MDDCRPSHRGTTRPSSCEMDGRRHVSGVENHRGDSTMARARHGSNTPSVTVEGRLGPSEQSFCDTWPKSRPPKMADVRVRLRF